MYHGWISLPGISLNQERGEEEMKHRYVLFTLSALLLAACEATILPEDGMVVDDCEIIDAPAAVDVLPDDGEAKDCGKHGGDEHISTPPGQAKR